MSSKATDPALRAGFMLMEVLVALVVAGLFLGVLGRAFATAWDATRRPRETVSAMTIARAVAQVDTPNGLPSAGTIDGYSYRRATDSVEIETLPSRLAPAPAGPGPSNAGAGSAGGMPLPVDTMPGVSEASPASRDTAPAAAPQRLRRISVVVTGPSGHRTSLETVRLDAMPN